MLLYAGQWIPFSKTTLFERPKAAVDAIIDSGRLWMIAIGFLLGAVIGWWAWRLAGPLAAIVAVAAFCLDPSFLAYAPLLKDDVPIALTLLMFTATIWLLGERVTLWRCIAAGILMGAAMTTKFSGVLAIPIIGIALLFRALLPEPWKAFRFVAISRAQRIAVAAAVTAAACTLCFCFIWAVYGFRFSPTSEPGQEIDFTSVMSVCQAGEIAASHGSTQGVPADVAGQWSSDWHPSLIPRIAGWMNLHHFLPQAWLEGVSSFIRPV